MFGFAECFGKRFCACGVDADPGGPFDGGEDAVEGVEENLFPRGEAESGKVEFLGIESALTDVMLGAFDVHPGGVVDSGCGTCDNFVSDEFWGGFFNAVDVVPVENEGLFGEVFECSGVL